MTHRLRLMIFVICVASTVIAVDAQGGERLCDNSRENCRTPLLDLIANERYGIDAAFWFAEDTRYSGALVAAHKRGVRVRVLVDPKATTSYPKNATILKELQDGGVPMRRITSSYLHWKFMIFAGQNVVQFGSANYTASAFYPASSTSWVDETIFFSDDPAIVNSFKTRYDDAWVSTSRFTNYANISGALTRAYPTYSTSSALNFPPFQDFGSRSVGRYNAETVGIDVIMFRLGDRRHADAIIAARARGIPVRLYTEQGQYRDPKRPLHSYDADRLYMAGVQIRHRSHYGNNHQKLTLLRSQRMAVFGSQNWTHQSGQYEANYFTTKPALYDALSALFARKWGSTSETKPFATQPPDIPVNKSPANAGVVSSSTATLRWWAGLWAHKYDIYFGTSSTPPLIASDVELGYSKSTSDLKSYTVTVLPGKTYYWSVRAKTMANRYRTSPVWSFRTP